VYSLFLFYFFFQAEDGIRDFHVTGVQTCALPICRTRKKAPLFGALSAPPRIVRASDQAKLRSRHNRLCRMREPANGVDRAKDDGAPCASTNRILFRIYGRGIRAHSASRCYFTSNVTLIFCS